MQAAYLLTGEEVTSRSQIKHLCPFDLRPGKRGWGRGRSTGDTLT